MPGDRPRAHRKPFMRGTVPTGPAVRFGANLKWHLAQAIVDRSVTWVRCGRFGEETERRPALPDDWAMWCTACVATWGKAHGFDAPWW